MDDDEEDVSTHSIQSEGEKMSSSPDATKEAVLRRIAGAEKFHPLEHHKFRIREQSVHVRYCKTNPTARYRFNINANTLTADYEVWICGSESNYYLVPISAIRMMYEDPAAYPDRRHPNMRIVQVNIVEHSALYAKPGRNYDLRDHRLAIL